MYSDISAYINHYPITSYNINGNTAVVAEDLQNYGFNIVWNAEERSLSITLNSNATEITPYGTVYKNSYRVGQKSYPYLETDIIAYVNGQRATSFNIDGKTCIYMEDLASCGEIMWVPEVRALKMWVANLPIRTYAAIEEAPIVEQLGLPCYDGTEIPLYDKATGASFEKLEYHTYWYKSGFERIKQYQNLLRKCGWDNETFTKFNYETYIDKNNTIKQRARSFSVRFKKGNSSVSLYYSYKTEHAGITLY